MTKINVNCQIFFQINQTLEPIKNYIILNKKQFLLKLLLLFYLTFEKNIFKLIICMQTHKFHLTNHPTNLHVLFIH